MTRVEELGISPMPWTACAPTKREVSVVCLKNDKWHSVQDVALCRSDRRNADARFIAAAPKMYEELRQEMERRYCVECKHAVWTSRGGIEIMTGCDGKGTCPKPSWKKVLAEASGEVVC